MTKRKRSRGLPMPPIAYLRRCPSRVGRCFELAGAAARVHWHWVLVHGRVTGANGQRFAHAWLERGERAYDPVHHREWPRKQYAEDLAAVVYARMQGPQVAALLAAAGHWGHWFNNEAAAALEQVEKAAQRQREARALEAYALGFDTARDAAAPGAALLFGRDAMVLVVRPAP